MFIRAYLRASTIEQDANRATGKLQRFVNEHNLKIAASYIENISGNKLERPELTRLIQESHDGDIILIESVDRLTRLSPTKWRELKKMLDKKCIHIVSLDAPTSQLILTSSITDPLSSSILQAVNKMLIEVLAATAYQDYTERRTKQRQGIDIAKGKNKYKGRTANIDTHNKILALSKTDLSINDIAEMLKVSRSTVLRVRRSHRPI